MRAYCVLHQANGLTLKYAPKEICRETALLPGLSAVLSPRSRVQLRAKMALTPCPIQLRKTLQLQLR